MSLLFIGGMSLYFALLIVRSRDHLGGRVTQSLEKRNMGADPDRSLTLTIDNYDISLGMVYAGSNSTVASANLDEFFTYGLNIIDYELLKDPA